jgi:GNAT superfamily N-acetyltransferase
MSDILDQIRFRHAGPGDAQALSSLAFRSKAHWGYDIDFMKRCKAELTYSAEDIEAPRSRFRLCELDGEPVAFYALELLGDGRAELEALFVKPELIGQGIGKYLVEHVRSECQLLGIRQVTIQGDPNAEDFYLSIGAVAAGYRESASIPGRFLPVFTLSLE